MNAKALTFRIDDDAGRAIFELDSAGNFTLGPGFTTQSLATSVTGLAHQLAKARAERDQSKAQLFEAWNVLHDWLCHEPGGTERFTKTLVLIEELRRAYP